MLNGCNSGVDIVLLSYLLISIPHTSFKSLFINIRKVLKNINTSQIIIHDFIANNNVKNKLKTKNI